MRARAWVTLAVLLCACAGPRPGTRRVGKVEITGNRHYEDGTIVNRLATRPKKGWLVPSYSTFDPIALHLDRKRIEAFYREHGYFDAKVTDVVVGAKGNLVNVKITVNEGVPTRVAAVRVVGPRADVAPPILEERTKIREGKVLKHPDYLIAKDVLRAELVALGYAHARVDGVVAVDRKRHRAEVRFDLDPGPLVRFGQLRVEGLRRVPESAVRARLAWAPGEVFDPEKISDTERRLYDLGLFSVVRVDYARDGRPEVSDVTIAVSEAVRHEIRLGFGVGLERARWEVRGRAGYAVRGFLSPLGTLRLDATPGYTFFRGADGTAGPSLEASASYTREDLVLPRLQGRALAAYDVEPREGYGIRGPRVELGLDRPFLDDVLKVHAGWQLRYLTFVDIDPAVFGPEAAVSRVAFFEQGLVVDYRDFALAPTRGWYVELQLEEGGPFAGGVQRYVKATPEVRGYVPLLDDRVVLAGRLRGGRIHTIGDDEAPITQRYFGGGATDHRGFGFRRLSPMVRDADGTLVPLGGGELLLASFEARVGVLKLRDRWIDFVPFVDGGDVTALGALALGNLHWAAGGGLRYDTVVGPIRLDLGVRLNRVEASGPNGLANPDPGDRFAIHLSLGEAF